MANGGTTVPGTRADLRCRVEGFDCQNEIQLLKGAVGFLISNEWGFSFGAAASLMTVAVPGGALIE